MKNVKKRNKVFRSMEEIEQKYFPVTFKKKLENTEKQEPGSFGVGLANKLLESIRRQLAR